MSEELKKEWERQIKERMNNFILEVRFYQDCYLDEVIDKDIIPFISSLLAKQQEENQKIIDGIFEIKEKELNCKVCGREGGHIMPIKESAYIGGVNLTTNDTEISSRLAVEDKLQTEFMEFWDEYKPKVGLGDYSDEITRFWFEKMETQKAEIISLIYSMILNKEVDDVEASKIVNKIRQ
jgi:hypothetical protein